MYYQGMGDLAAVESCEGMADYMNPDWYRVTRTRQGLGQLSPDGQDCGEIKRIYEREKRLSRTRSKKSHRTRHRRNAERYAKAFRECQNLTPEAIPVAAGGLPDPLATLTTSGVPSVAGSSVPEMSISSGAQEPSLDYTRIAMMGIGAAVVLGGLIFLARPKKPKAS